MCLLLIICIFDAYISRYSSFVGWLLVVGRPVSLTHGSQEVTVPSGRTSGQNASEREKSQFINVMQSVASV